MITYRKYILHYFLAASFITIFHSANGQKTTRIELLNANSLEYDESLGKKFRRLIGNVSFKHEGAVMYCDSAYLYADQNSVDAFGNIRILQGDSMQIYGDVLNYNADTKKAKLTGNARMSDGKMVLTTPSLDYDVANNSGTYFEGGKIIDNENTLVSKAGYYFSKSRDFHFRDSVLITHPEYSMQSDSLKYNIRSKIIYFFGPTTILGKEDTVYCENGWYDQKSGLSVFSRNAQIKTRSQVLKGDSLVYNKKSGAGTAYRNVEIIDTAEKTVVSGDYAEYNRREETSFMTGRALLTQAFEKDSMFLHADTLKVVKDSIKFVVPVLKSDSGTVTAVVPEKSKKKKEKEKNKKTVVAESDKLSKDSVVVFKVMHAWHGVKIFKPDLQGACDSMVYSYRDSVIRLFRNPVLWSKENQMTADSISIEMKQNKIHRLHLVNNALIISQLEYRKADSTLQKDPERFNQVKGKTMTGFFENNELRSIAVEGNGQAIYYGKDKKEKLAGVNRAECSNMIIYIKESSIDKINLVNAPDATFYPVDELSTKELLLKGFNWQPERRPEKKESVFMQ